MTSEADNKVLKYREELVGYLKECYDFGDLDSPALVLKKLSAFSARASWLRQGIIKSPLPVFVRFRIDELDPFLTEVDRQFKIWSRISSIEQFEWDKSKG